MRNKSIWVGFIAISLLISVIGFASAQSPPTPPGASVPCAAGSASLSVSSTSNNVALPVNSPSCLVVTLTNDGSTEIFYALGGSAVTATVNSFPLLAGYSVSFWTTSTYIAAITASSTSTLRIVQANGPMPQSHKFGSPPPTCSNQLDFTKACNSQYFAMGGLL